MEIIKRRHAAAAGQLSYFTGKPCPRGHIATRNVATRNCYACLADDAKKRRAKDPTRAAAKDRAKYLRDPAKVMARVSRWQASNPEKVRGYKGKWQAENPDAMRARTRNRRARVRQALGTHTASDIREILKWQRGRCAYCPTRLDPSSPVDHIVSLKKGGSNDRRNLQILCLPCNSKKGAKDPIVFAREIGLLI